MTSIRLRIFLASSGSMVTMAGLGFAFFFAPLTLPLGAGVPMMASSLMRSLAYSVAGKISSSSELDSSPSAGAKRARLMSVCAGEKARTRAGVDSRVGEASGVLRGGGVRGREGGNDVAGVVGATGVVSEIGKKRHH